METTLSPEDRTIVIEGIVAKLRDYNDCFEELTESQFCEFQKTVRAEVKNYNDHGLVMCLCMEESDVGDWVMECEVEDEDESPDVVLRTVVQQ